MTEPSLLLGNQILGLAVGRQRRDSTMTSIVIEGNTADEASLRYTKDGKAVASVTVIVNDRSRNTEGEWVDGATSSYRVTVWGKPAETFAASATKGVRLFAAGELSVSEWTDNDGNKRATREINADHTGLSSRFTVLSADKPNTNP